MLVLVGLERRQKNKIRESTGRKGSGLLSSGKSEKHKRRENLISRLDNKRVSDVPRGEGVRGDCRRILG